MRNYDEFTERLISLFYPRRCPVCDEPVPVGEGLACSECRRRIRYIDGAKCRKCGKHLQDESLIYCADCEKRTHIFEYGYALYNYRNMKDSIYRFKYQKRCEYAKFYARDIYDRLADEIGQMGADALIPVPLYRTKKAARGYNQAQALADELSGLTGIPSYSHMVKRVRNTVPQKTLDDIGRQNNLKRAFLISPDVVKLKKAIIVDDIYTTGSTIDAVARELKQHGVGKVYFITLCIGEGM